MPSQEDIDKILSILNGAVSKSEKKRIAVQSGFDPEVLALVEAEALNQQFAAQHFPPKKSEPTKEPIMKNHGGRYVPQEVLFPLYAKWAAAENLSEAECRKELSAKGYDLSNTAFRKLLERMHLVDKLVTKEKYNPGRALNTMVMRKEIDELRKEVATLSSAVKGTIEQVEKLVSVMQVLDGRIGKHSKLIEKRRIENKATRSELQMLYNRVVPSADAAVASTGDSGSEHLL